MPRSRYRTFESKNPYFLTCTMVGWLPEFTRPETVNVLFENWRYLAAHAELKLYGYVVLENHTHFIASAPDLANAVKRFKMFTVRTLLDLL